LAGLRRDANLRIVTGAMRGPMPPCGVINDFLPLELHDQLLEWTIAQEPAFNPAGVYYGEGGREHAVDPDSRVGLKRFGIGPFEPLIGERLLDRLDEIMAAAGYRGPEPRSIEFEITASGDGAYFGPHLDIALGAGRRTIGRNRGEDRMISTVYYFHRLPKAFSGGALRLYRFGVDEEDVGEGDSIAFEPARNSLVAFPSFARHSVEPVRCPSGEFAD
jgi:SM-20-related protein